MVDVHVVRHRSNLPLIVVVGHSAAMVIGELRHGILEPSLVLQGVAIGEFDDVLVRFNDTNQLLEGLALAHEPECLLYRRHLTLALYFGKCRWPCVATKSRTARVRIS